MKNTNTSGFADIAINYGMAGDWDADGINAIVLFNSKKEKIKMKSINILFRITVLLSLVLGALAVTPTQAAIASTQINDVASNGVSPEAYLNPDGTLKLGANFSGSFDIKNWNVQLDPGLGPVFSPIATQDDWTAVGTGGGAFNDVVNSIIVNGTDVYVGGWFRDLDGIPEADYIARWDGAQWNALASNGAGDGALSGSAVNTMAFFGGNLYVGGGFSAVDTSGAPLAQKLAKWNGSAWSAVGGVSTANGAVNALAIFDDTSITNNDMLYISGEFTNFNSNARADYTAMYNITTNTWSNMGDDGIGGGSLADSAYAVAVDTATGEVYAGGFFTNVNNNGAVLSAADYIAKWDGANWSALGSSSIASGVVLEILVADSTHIYVGGAFTDVDGIAAADYIAKWNGSAWSALGSFAGNGALTYGGVGSAAVRSMQLNGGVLYAAGNFGMSDPALAAGKHLAKYDTGTDTWSIADDNGVNASIFGTSADGLIALTISSGRLYIGGYFSDITDDGALLPTADYFASMTLVGDVWSAYGNINGLFHGDVYAIAAMGTDIYVGGNFYDLGGDARMDCLVRWDGTKWNPLGNLNESYGSLNGHVRALAVDGTDLYVGGDFTYAYNNGVYMDPIGKIGKWDSLTQTWSALGFGATVDDEALNNSVWSIAVLGNNVYAGGTFTNVNDQGSVLTAADYIARWDKTDGHWYALSSNGSANGALPVSGYVKALATNGTDLYVGGQFSSVLNTSNVAIINTPYLAKWDGANWSAFPGLTTPFNSYVFALAYSGGDLYTGGNFFDANGIAGTNYIAVWNSGTQTWSQLGNASIDNPVYSITVDGANIYAGGSFTDVSNGGVPVPEADYAAKWNGVRWSALGSNGAGNGSINTSVLALAVIQNDVWAGGNFQNVNNNGAVLKAADFLAVYGFPYKLFLPLIMR